MSGTMTSAERGASSRARERWLTVYAIDATLLICHEIDSAYWREWDLFRIPGGAPVFVALHLIVVPVILLGALQIVGGWRAAGVTSAFVGVAGLLGCLVHLGFLATGDGAFRTPFSTGLVLAFGLSSAALLLALFFARGSPPASQAGRDRENRQSE